MVDAVEVHDAAVGLLHCPRHGGVAEHVSFERRLAVGVSGAVDGDVAGVLGQHAGVDPVLVGQMREERLAGTVPADDDDGQPVRRIAHRTLELLDAGTEREVAADRLVIVDALGGADRREQLPHRGVLGLVERGLQVALETAAMQEEHRARVDLDDHAVPHELVEVLAGEVAAHRAVRRYSRRGEHVDGVGTELSRDLVEMSEYLVLGI